MKIDPQVPENTSPSPKQPKNKKELPKWLLPVGIAILVAGFAVMIFIPKSTPDTKPHTTEQSTTKTTKTNKSSKSGESSSSKSEIREPAPSKSSESTSPSKSSESTTNQPVVDMKPAITKFFTAFQEYSTEKDSPKSRADKMREVATADTVSSLIPNNTETGGQSASIAATYTFVKPLEIVADSNVAGNYAVVMTYSVKVMENTTQYTDTYIVGTEGDKITSVSKRSSVMDN